MRAKERSWDWSKVYTRSIETGISEIIQQKSRFCAHFFACHPTAGFLQQKGVPLSSHEGDPGAIYVT